VEIRVTTRDDVMYVVDSDDEADDALGAFLDASDEEWVPVVPAATRTNRLFVRRSEIKLVATVEDEVAVEDDAGAPTETPPDQIF